MKTNLPIQKYFPTVGPIAYGCMGLGGQGPHVLDADVLQAHKVIDCALESNIHFFDHADIYRDGRAERVFGIVLSERPELRSHMVIQSKCGIRKKNKEHVGLYDFSAEWVRQSVDGILARLNLEYLDVLMLHRPDPLMDVEQLAMQLIELNNQGKIKHIAVSNMNLHQISFLQRELDLPIIANQIEMSLAKLDWLDDGVMVGTQGSNLVDFVSGTIEYCQSNNIQLQAWGSLAKGQFSEHGLYSDELRVRKTTELVKTLANKYQVSGEAIVLAFLLRHPAKVQPVIGTTHEKRIKNATQAIEICLERHDWYDLYVTSRGNPLP
ncbi:aldo/keto reductase [Pseudoalteromonas luteoviolacea]|uniref:Aldo/keto reductase n=1 Tax=Pseudoalteromonas luteoviolacea TaxID=43657 RepID=A0A0C1QCZ0_9GAMM|nr:aldo/keto reductase [Pseudoalteromonas luteoviolacea]KID57300.1 aldo/keto reductase [Pseudoalteromonas luteoviolacea]